jgi:hypothetical protein
MRGFVEQKRRVERKKRVLKLKFGERVGFFSDNFDHRIVKKELEKAQFR